MKQEEIKIQEQPLATLFSCPICDFVSEDYDTVLSHLWSEHEDEAYTDMKPIELGEVDQEVGKCYVDKNIKILKTKKSEEKEIILHNSSSSICQSNSINEKIINLQTEISEVRKENQFLHNELLKFIDTLVYLKKSLHDEAYQHAQTRQSVAKLETYLTTKNNGHRRDFDLLAVDLKKEVLRRGRKGLDYNDVMLLFRFKSHQEAYRLMELTAILFSDEIRMHQSKSHKQSKKLIPFG